MAKKKAEEKKEPGAYDGLIVRKGGKLVHQGEPPVKKSKKKKK